MLIRNRQRDTLPSNLTTEQLGQAMSQLDLSGVPPEKRPAAIRDHLMRIMADSIHDKQTAFEIHASRLLRRQRS